MEITPAIRGTADLLSAANGRLLVAGSRTTIVCSISGRKAGGEVGVGGGGGGREGCCG